MRHLAAVCGGLALLCPACRVKLSYAMSIDPHGEA